MKKIKVIFPDGSIAEIEQSELDSAIKAGAKVYKEQRKSVFVFPDGSETEVEEPDINSAIAAGAVKKKEAVPSDSGTELTDPFSLRSMSAIAAGLPTSFEPPAPVSRNPYASILKLTAKTDIPEDRKTLIYNEAVTNKNLQPLIDLVKEEKDKLRQKKDKYIESIKPAPDLTGTTDLIMATQIPGEPKIFEEDNNRIKSIQQDAADAIDNVMADKLISAGILNGDAKLIGEERRKLRSEIEEEPGYIDQRGLIDEQKKLKSKYKFGYKIGKERNQQEFDFLNEHGIYESALKRLDDEITPMLGVPKIQEFLNGTPEQRKILKNDNAVIEFINKAEQFYGLKDAYESLVLKYPEVRNLTDRQIIADYWAGRVAKERDVERLRDLTSIAPGHAIVMQLKNLFVGDKPDTEQEYREISDITNIPIERVKDVLENQEITNPVGVPSSLGLYWRMTVGNIRSLAQGLNRAFMSKDAANLVNKEIELERYRRPEQLKKNWTLDRIFDTMADIFGQFTGFVATGGATGLVPKMIASGLLKQIPLRAAATGGNLLAAMNRAINIGSTFITGSMASLEDAYQYAATQTDNEDRRWEYAKSVAAANGASELLLRDIDVANKILKGKSPVKILQEIASRRTPFNSADIFKARMAEVARVISYESAEELVPYFTEILQKENIFGYQTSTSEFFQGMFDTVIETAIGTIPLGGLSASRVAASSNLTKAALLEAAKTPGYYTGRFEEMFNKGLINEEQKNRNVKIINTLADIYSKIPGQSPAGREFTEVEKADLVSKIFSVRQLKSAMEQMDESFAPAVGKLIKELEKDISGFVEKGAPPTVAQKKEGQVFTDFDDTVFKDGRLTAAGEELKARAAAGENVVVLTARDATPENISFIAGQLGIPEANVKAGLKTPESKAAQLTPGSVYYNENDAELAAASAIEGVSVVDVKQQPAGRLLTEEQLRRQVGNEKADEAVRAINEIIDADAFPDGFSPNDKTFAKENPLQFLRQVAEQAQRVDEFEGRQISARQGVINTYGETIVNLAEETFPQAVAGTVAAGAPLTYTEADFDVPFTEDIAIKMVRVPVINEDGSRSETEMQAEQARQMLGSQKKIIDQLLACLT